jgi:hypothetical protein
MVQAAVDEATAAVLAGTVARVPISRADAATADARFTLISQILPERVSRSPRYGPGRKSCGFPGSRNFPGGGRINPFERGEIR